jgi:hypothetical protein
MASPRGENRLADLAAGMVVKIEPPLPVELEELTRTPPGSGYAR